jgi:HK97 family phage major capsid protein
MSKSKYVKELEEAAEKTNDPVLGGIVKIASGVEEDVSKIDKRVDEISEKNIEAKRETMKEIEKVRTELKAGFDLVGDRVETLTKRQVLGHLYTDATPDLVAAIPTDKRHMIQIAERSMGKTARPDNGRPIEEKGNFADPVFKAASALWFRTASLLQLTKTRNVKGLSDQLDKLDAAFASAYSGGESKAISDMAEISGPSGGFLVPAPVEAEVLRLIEDNAVMRPLVRKMTMSSKTLQVPTKGNAITAYIGVEGGSLTGSYDQTAFSSVTLTAKRFHGRATMSVEVLEDSIIGLLPYILTTLGEEIAILEDQETLEGSGTNFTGVNAASGVNSVATTTTNGEAPVYGDLTATIFAARQRSSRIGARWFMSPELFGKIIGMVDSNGQPIVQYGRVPNEIMPQILGFPVELLSTLDIAITRGSTGNTANAYFGPPTTVLFGDRMGVRWDVSDAPNWATYEMDARLVKRTGIVVGVPTAWTKLVGSTFA